MASVAAPHSALAVSLTQFAVAMGFAVTTPAVGLAAFVIGVFEG
jgi:putative Mn2+ efflux pump MntP